MNVEDQATALEELARMAALQTRKPEGPAATGLCLNCGAAINQPRRWCDADCHSDWEARAKRST